jgi:hypothetical protein
MTTQKAEAVARDIRKSLAPLISEIIMLSAQVADANRFERFFLQTDKKGDEIVSRMDAVIAERIRAMPAAPDTANERAGLLKLLRELITGIDIGGVRMESAEIQVDDDAPHPWHEEWLSNVRAAVARAEGDRE